MSTYLMPQASSQTTSFCGEVDNVLNHNADGACLHLLITVDNII